MSGRGVCARRQCWRECRSAGDGGIRCLIKAGLRALLLSRPGHPACHRDAVRGWHGASARLEISRDRRTEALLGRGEGVTEESLVGPCSGPPEVLAERLGEPSDLERRRVFAQDRERVCDALQIVPDLQLVSAGLRCL